MRSRWLLVYLSLNRLLNSILSCSWCYFVKIQLISQKFNVCDGRTDGRTDIPSYRDARTHLKKRWEAGRPAKKKLDGEDEILFPRSLSKYWRWREKGRKPSQIRFLPKMQGKRLRQCSDKICKTGRGRRKGGKSSRATCRENQSPVQFSALV